MVVLAVEGEGEFDLVGMEVESFGGVGTVFAVEAVACDWHAEAHR